tara:strand:- start:1362 stop:6470 length:5109 start_codon:yes stop_codon:yes gene_type:complete
MSFNIFGPSEKPDIKVGYISTTRGYVEGVSRYEANKYAKLNPGTQFVLKRRDKIEFMNINGVNALEPDDLLPKNSAAGEGCSGITGLDIYEDDDDGSGGRGGGGGGGGRDRNRGGGRIKSDSFDDRKPQVRFSGGGGIGAKGNPIFGNDGSLLAVDLIEGGWGYAYAPITEVFDEYGIGAGAVVRSIMVGDPNYPKCKFVETVKTFENEEDFEEYDLSRAPDETFFGKKYDLNGREVGVWDPNAYANLRRSPVAIEQRRYQNFLESLRRGTRISLQSNIIRNWWTTRRDKPLRITALNKKSRTIHKVTHPAWSEFMNKHAVSPVPPSNVPGSDFAGIEHTLEWEENFPYDGDYNFRYAADNVADIYLDNELVGRTRRFKDSPDKITKFVPEGVHRIRVDLENIPILKTVTKQRDEKRFIETEFEVYGQGSQRHRAIKFTFTSDGGEHSFVLNNTQKNSKSYKKNIKVLRNTNYKVVAVADGATEEPQIGQREFKLQYAQVEPGAGRRVVGSKKIEFDDNIPNGFDLNATFKIVSSSPGLVAKFNESGTKLIVKGNSSGDVTIKLNWNDNPARSGVAVGSITIGDTTWRQSGEKGEVTKTIKINKIVNKKSNSGVLEQGTMQSFGVREKEKGNKPSKIIFADYIGSANDNDDMQVRVNRGTFTATNKRRITAVGPQGKQTRGTFDLDFKINIKPELRGSASSNAGFEMEEIFNTKKSINNADRKLWRINPEAGRDADFLSRFGVLPFNPQSNKATTNDFDGTHIIRWEYVDFPISGNYNFEIMADDSATVYIGNRAGGGKKEIGNGLRDINAGGDEVIIRKLGFSSPGKSTGKSFETRYFDAGKYRIRVALKQIRGKPLAGGNPMAFAMRIRTTAKEKTVVSAKSWNENPMGVAISINAPLPPAPQEPIPPQEGRCPRNPYWTTRFPGSNEKWYPVTHPAWSGFMNRFAMSPVLPLGTPDSDNGGQVFRTSWVIDAPYDGFYGMKGTVDNGGRILVDDRVVLQGGLGYSGNTLEGFKSSTPETVKFPLEKGKHTITAEVINQQTETLKTVRKKVFDTKDWLTKPKAGTTGKSHKITYVGLSKGGGSGGKGEYTISYSGDGRSFGKRMVSQTKFEFDDDVNNGFDLNSSFEILSTSSGIKAKFSNDGSKLIVSGKEKGTVTLKFAYDDNPKTKGTAVKEIKVGGKTWKASGEKGSKTLTIDVKTGGGGKANPIRVSSNGKKITIDDNPANGFDVNTTFEIVSGKAKFSQDGQSIEGDGKVDIKLSWDDDPGNSGVAVEKIKIRGVTWTQSGERGKQKQSVELKGGSPASGLSGGTKGGVTYAGPTELASYRKGFISPLFQEINEPTEEIQGKTWVMRWENVDFPVDGRYKIRTECDDVARIFIDGVRVQTARLGVRNIKADPVRYETFNATKGKKTVEIRLRNIRIPNTSFQENPTVVKMDITTDVSVSTGRSRPWTTNPIGISAILIPPPCPLKIIGKGRICQVVVDDPGNGYPKPPDGGTGPSEYPVTLVLVGVDVLNPGINYNCGEDQLVIEPSNGVKLTYDCDTFGRITKVNVEPETPAQGPGGSGDTPVGRGFTRQPEIRMITSTGVNFQAVPRFEVVRDPVDPDILPEQIIQVTDLVGLKQTGYINGRPYYGQVFYKEGVRYAGVYETPGQLIQVYDTLKESIDAEVTTPPSAILRQGTDISSNDPRLNIPGTTDSLS